MKAVVLAGVGDIRVLDVPGPTIIAAGDAIVRVTTCGFHGFWPPGFTANGHPVSPELATLFHG